MNLQQLKAKYGKATQTTTATTEVKETMSAASVLTAGLFGRTVNKTSDVVKTAGSAVGNVMPATRKSVKDLAATMNNKFNEVEEKLFEHELYIHMIAQAKGVNLPSEEEVKEIYKEYLKEQEEQTNETEALAEVESTISTIISSVTDSVLSALDKKLNITSDVEEEIVEVTEEEEIEEVEETPAPKKETTGRRKLGRQAPLAE